MVDLAIVTGAANGLGRALTLEFAQKGYNLALCDVDEEALQGFAQEVRRLYDRQVFVQGCDVSDLKQVLHFRDCLLSQNCGSLNVLVNNAGIIGGSSFFKDSLAHWERTFNVNWGGTYNFTRAFLPELSTAASALIVNICSSSGFWASSSANLPLSAYSTSKFAVKGFTEALILDCRHHAPHIKPVLVLLGRIATQLNINSASYLGIQAHLPKPNDEPRSPSSQLESSVSSLSPQKSPQEFSNQPSRQAARVPLSATEAAQEIMAAIDRGEWRIVIGEGAKLLDQAVRAAPQRAYEPAFFQELLELCNQGLEEK